MNIFTILLAALIVVGIVYGIISCWYIMCLGYAQLALLRGMIATNVLRAADAEGLDLAAKAERVKEVMDSLKPLPRAPLLYNWWVTRYGDRYDPMI